MIEPIQVITAVATADEARKIARHLVERRLAACVQVLGPIESTYHWQNAIEENQEWLCIAKTELARWDEIEQAIRHVHSYEVPEILAVPVARASGPYLQWLTRELGSRQ